MNNDILKRENTTMKIDFIEIQKIIDSEYIIPEDKIIKIQEIINDSDIDFYDMEI